MKTMKAVDFSQELSQLMIFVSHAILSVGPISYEGTDNYRDKKVVYADLMWLCDIFRNFKDMGPAIETGNYSDVIRICDNHLELFSMHNINDPDSIFKHLPLELHDEWRHRVNLDDAIDTLRQIKAKAERQLVLDSKEYNLEIHSSLHNKPGLRSLTGPTVQSGALAA